MTFKHFVNKAADFARECHKGQVRKYEGDEPYIAHPARVAARVKILGMRYEVEAAAWLHDVVEDCGVPIYMIVDMFGGDVGYMVACMTNVSKHLIDDGIPRHVRKAMDRAQMIGAGDEVHTLRACDMLDNMPSNVKHGSPKYVKMYLEECRSMADVLTEAHPTPKAELRRFLEANPIPTAELQRFLEASWQSDD